MWQSVDHIDENQEMCESSQVERKDWNVEMYFIGAKDIISTEAEAFMRIKHASYTNKKVSKGQMVNGQNPMAEACRSAGTRQLAFRRAKYLHIVNFKSKLWSKRAKFRKNVKKKLLNSMDMRGSWVGKRRQHCRKGSKNCIEVDMEAMVSTQSVSQQRRRGFGAREQDGGCGVNGDGGLDRKSDSSNSGGKFRRRCSRYFLSRVRLL